MKHLLYIFCLLSTLPAIEILLFVIYMIKSLGSRRVIFLVVINVFGGISDFIHRQLFSFFAKKAADQQILKIIIEVDIFR